jgi:DNA modification methylase
MFPSRFSDFVVQKYSQPGDAVLDPFAGRGTSLFSAAVRGRHALGVEINPVGWIYASTKLLPAPEEQVVERLEEVGSLAKHHYDEARKLPPFFHGCYTHESLAFLLAARRH